MLLMPVCAGQDCQAVCCIMGAPLCCLCSQHEVVAVLCCNEVEPDTLPAGIIGAMDVDDNG